MEGFYVIDKPEGITSYQVIRYLKKFIKGRKIGHAGNLDPGATGVLVVGIGRATRFLEYVMELEKEYVGTIKLGILTDTLDLEGEVLIKKPVPELDEFIVRNVFKKFQGEIEQVPPSYSAIRIQGKRLYELARQGVMITPKARRVKIYKLEVIGIEPDRIHFRAVVGKGTYLRALARDIAQELGTVGIIEKLRRTRIGHFKEEQAIPMERINEKNYLNYLISIGEGLSFLPYVYLSDRAADFFRQGNMISKAGIIKRDPSATAFSLVRVFDSRGNFIGVGFLKWEGVIPRKVLP